MADIENKIENGEKLSDEELEQVAGGTLYFNPEIYEQYGVLTMDDGKTFMYGKREITELQAAAITFYSIQLPEDMVKAARQKGADQFINTATAYRLANLTKFEAVCSKLNDQTGSMTSGNK